MNPYLATTIDDTTAGQDWRARAACRGQHRLFDAATDGRVAAVRAAQAICAGCPVRAQCLTDARARRQHLHGVWGGIPFGIQAASPNKGRELAPCGTEAAHARHKRNGQDPCDACRKAHTRYETERANGTRPMNTNTKLTPDKVREIRRRGQAGDRHADIATDHDMSPVQISKIIRREAWRHIA